jgi:tripartite-type tricarboxylate transporter receptor subunit TctC
MLHPILQFGREWLPVLPDTQTAIEAGFPDRDARPMGASLPPAGKPPDVTASMAKSVKEILSEPAIAAQLRDTQQMKLLLGDAGEFSAIFTKQVSYWGQVVRKNNIRT